ncbi:MAG: RCC1 domain-containing protein [Bacteroidota bacterium]
MRRHPGITILALVSILTAAGSACASRGKAVPVAAIAAGYNHTVVLKRDGTVWAWGSNERGQLDDNPSAERTAPVLVQGLTGVTAIACGGAHTLALKRDGTVWVWGGKPAAALGDESECPCTAKQDNQTKGGAIVLRQVAGLRDITAVAAGDAHSLALGKNGAVWAWGANKFNQVGDGTAVDRSAPVPVPKLSGIAALAAGARATHTLALGADGTVWTWGWNKYGQLGDGTTANKSMPIRVPGLAGVKAVAAGANHSMALKKDGTVWTWGSNYFGQLGDGTTRDRFKPGKVPGLSGVTAIASGATHCLALKKDGTVWAWGSNNFGQLGDGTNSGRAKPVRVKDLAHAAAIASGALHALALQKDGTVWAWGWNSRGELGDGTTFDRTAPVRCLI